jgi:hypothetical protein
MVGHGEKAMSRRLTIQLAAAVIVAGAAALTGPVAALADDDTPPVGADVYTNAAVLTPNKTFAYSNTGYTATAEPYSATSAKRCDTTNAAMQTTIWFKVIGTGGRIVLSTGGYSTVDTVLARYFPNQLPSEASADFCNDDFLGTNGGSEMQLATTIPGAVYYTQWGVCDPSVTMCGATSGKIGVTAITNDARDHPDTGTGTRSNVGAFADSGETLSCDGAAYGRTVWFKWTAPANGRATFSASGFDTVMSAYLGAGATPTACNDDAGSVLRSEVSLDVQQGQEWLIQVGGKQFAPSSYGQDNFSYATTFTPAAPTSDADGDTFARAPGPDCDDANATIHPGAVDVPFDGIDQDCKGGDNKDRDGDGYAAKPYGPDCNDANKAVNPGAKERRGNWVDENCDKRAAAGTSATQPDVACAGCSILGGAVRFGAFRMGRVHAGDVVIVRCHGSKRCPKTVRKVVKKKKRTITVRYHHALPRRTAIVEIFVERPASNVFGFYLRYRSGKRKAGCSSPPASQHSGAPRNPHIVACPT